MNHFAKTGTAAVGPGTTLSVRSGALHAGDSLDLNAPDGGRRQVLIKSIDASQLVFAFDGQMAVCRPWHAGDPGVYRLPGTSSNWVVERLEADAMSDAG